MTKKAAVFFLMSAALALAPASRAAAAAFESLGLGARALGMSDSAVAVSGNFESVFWNPSGIASLDKKTFQSEYRDLYGLGLLRYIVSGYAHPGVGRGAVAVTWYRLDTVGDASTLDYAENTIAFTYGTYVFDPLFLGATGKYYRVNSTVGAGGMGFDLGLSYEVSERWLTLGAAVQDTTRTLISWDSGVKDRLPLQVRAGTSSKIFSKTLLTTQVSWKDESERSNHAGLEQKLLADALTLRFGGVERDGLWRFSFGVGLKVRALTMDYGWQRHRYLGDTQAISLSLGL